MKMIISVLLAIVPLTLARTSLPSYKMFTYRESDEALVRERAASPNDLTKVYDASTAVSADNQACMQHAGWTFPLFRMMRSNGELDPNFCTNGQVALNVSQQFMMYIWPCNTPDCITKLGDGTKQMQTVINALQQCWPSGVRWGTVWIDIETSSALNTWSSSTSDNVQFIQQLMDAWATFGGYPAGVYSSASSWTTITGNSNAFTSHILWYARYGSSSAPAPADMSDFDAHKFGGWSTAGGNVLGHQYKADQSACSIGYDANVFAM